MNLLAWIIWSMLIKCSFSNIQRKRICLLQLRPTESVQIDPKMEINVVQWWWNIICFIIKSLLYFLSWLSFVTETFMIVFLITMVLERSYSIQNIGWKNVCCIYLDWLHSCYPGKKSGWYGTLHIEISLRWFKLSPLNWTSL